MRVKEIPIDQVVVGKNVRLDPEEELGGLMESIEKHDLLQPVLVVPLPDGRYELVAGHRRLAAMKARNEPTIPAIIRSNVSRDDIPYLQLIENVQRKEMSAREVAKALDAIKATKPGINAYQLGKLVGKSDAWVYDTYSAAKMTDELIAAGVSEAELRGMSKTDLANLSRVKDADARMDAAKKAVGGDKAVIDGSREIRHRMARVDRSGGLAIMGGEGSLTIHVICGNAEARDQAIEALLRLKAKRLKNDQSRA